jgi:hypothetical protein
MIRNRSYSSKTFASGGGATRDPREKTPNLNPETVLVYALTACIDDCKHDEDHLHTHVAHASFQLR